MKRDATERVAARCCRTKKGGPPREVLLAERNSCAACDTDVGTGRSASSREGRKATRSHTFGSPVPGECRKHERAGRRRKTSGVRPSSTGPVLALRAGRRRFDFARRLLASNGNCHRMWQRMRGRRARDLVRRVGVAPLTRRVERGQGSPNSSTRRRRCTGFEFEEGSRETRRRRILAHRFFG
jgi:hypothetical protein